MRTTLKDITDELPTPSKKDIDLLTKSYDFAQKAHFGQLRKSGEPYFLHVFATAKYLAEMGMSAPVIAAGFLHDTLEDTDVTEVQMEQAFGKEITGLVKNVTKLGKVKYKGMERNVENLRKFFISIAEDFRVLIIKLADRLHNVETLAHVRPDKQRRIALETLEIYAPLANRLSMGQLKGLLEDHSFPFAYPKEYAETKKLFDTRQGIDEKHLFEFEKTLLKKLRDEKIEYLAVDHRVKHLYSLWKKLRKYDMDIDQIYDIIALRIMVKNIEDCYRVLGIIHGNWRPLPGRIKDYIATPKPNGYQSLHTTVLTGTGSIVEVQIRTEEMHHQAEYGIAAHFAYKEGVNLEKKNLKKQYEWITQLRDAQEKISDTNAFFENLKMDFFKDRVFAFTPKGDIIDLPEGASIIDFAYNVHSDIGDHASGAKVNGRFVALDTKLRNGDICEVVVQKTAKPNAKWLAFAKTSTAKSHINRQIKSSGGNSLLDRYKKFLKQ